MSRTQMKQSSKSNSKRNNYSGSTVIFAGNWGDWKPLQTAPAGSLLCGIKYNHSLDYPKANRVGVDGVVAVFCDEQNWKTQKDETCAEKSFGEYRDLMCPEGSYVSGLSVKEQPPAHFSNNDGIETILLSCYNPYTHVRQYLAGLYVNTGEWVDSYQPKFFNALQVRYDNSWSDPTGTNGMAGSLGELKCKDDYLRQNNIDCFKALDNCKSDKQSGDKCSECNDGFLLFDSACYQTITACETQDHALCTKCDCGHFLDKDSLCYSKRDNCDQQSGEHCQKCIDLMIPSTTGTCIQQIANCQEQQDAVCVVCNEKFTLASNICVKLDVVEGCEVKVQAPVQDSRRNKSMKIKSNKNVKRNKMNSKRLSMRN